MKERNNDDINILGYSSIIIIALFPNLIEAYNLIVKDECGSIESITNENADTYIFTNFRIWGNRLPTFFNRKKG